MTLNGQEKRNAIPCKFGQLVRDTARKHADGFGRIYSKIKEGKEVIDQKKITAQQAGDALEVASRYLEGNWVRSLALQHFHLIQQSFF